MISKTEEALKNGGFEFPRAHYICGRYKRLIPNYLVFTICYFVLMYITNKDNFFYWIKHSFLSFLILQVFGIGDYGRNFGAVWYITVLLACSYIIYSMIYIFEDKVNYILFPLCFIGYLFMHVTYGGVTCRWDTSRSIFSNPCIIRGFCDISVGVILYNAVKNKKCKCANILELLFFGFATILGLCEDCTWLALLMIIISIYFGLRNSSNDNRLYANKIVTLLYGLTYSIYLNHPLFVDFNILNFIDSGKIRMVVYLVLVVAFSFCTNFFMGCVLKGIRSVKIKLFPLLERTN